ncbi:cytochrome P450 [Saccharothrix ecbatanensis]|uniref:Cytochrome P450 n=1 Tax=Saccharothrix ecbatanensis TaxID=1105145 RepID=A0A7W9M595_9PSEU|nr:cytochrome P450 [Saccharothrix ecbatanensis]MBB5807956.1 cytochrome P450 [Saccharothrix ecbatanensis]
MKSDLVSAALPDVGAPIRRIGRIPLANRLDHLPGESGAFAGYRNVAGWVRRGDDHLREQVERFGPVYRHMFGVDPIVCVADPDLVSRVGRNRDKCWSSGVAWGYYLSGMDDSIEGWDGILTLDEVPHRDVRRLLSPAFAPDALESYARSCQKLVEEEVAGWVGRGRIEAKAAIRKLLVRISALIFMGVEDPREAEQLDRTIRGLWLASFTPAVGIPLGAVRSRMLKSYRGLLRSLTKRIAENPNPEGTDLFSRFCRARGEIEWTDDETLARTFISTMLAAFDTNTLSMSSMAHVLSHHPDWQEQLREEALDASSGEPSVQVLARMEKTERVWNETMRLFPVSSHVMRRNLVDTELGGHEIPAGTLVFALLGPPARHPEAWTQPAVFDPDRFSPDRSEHRSRPGIFSPFGVGAHVCVGGLLAGHQVKMVYRTLLSQARIAPVGKMHFRHSYAPLGSVAGRVHVELRPLRGVGN